MALEFENYLNAKQQPDSERLNNYLQFKKKKLVKKVEF